MKIKCIRPDELPLTSGKIYEGNDYGNYYNITNDDGIEGVVYFKRRFELVEEQTKQTNMEKYTKENIVGIVFQADNDGCKFIISKLKDNVASISYAHTNVECTTYMISSVLLFLNKGDWKVISEPKRNQIGWKVIKDFPGNRFAVHEKGSSGYDFLIETISENEIKPSQYQEYFEPVYEEVKKKEMSKTITIGTPAREIEIRDDGEIFMQASRVAKIDGVYFLRKLMLPDEHHGLRHNFTITNIWYGCPSQGTSLNVKDLELILATYDELKNQ